MAISWNTSTNTPAPTTGGISWNTPPSTPAPDSFHAMAAPSYAPTFGVGANDSTLAKTAETLGNIPGSAVNFGANVLKSLNPLSTAKTAADLGTSLGDAANEGDNPIQLAKDTLTGLPQAAYQSEAFQKLFSGDLAGATKQIEEDPVGQIAPLALLKGKTAIAKTDSAAGSIAETAKATVSAPKDTFLSLAQAAKDKVLGTPESHVAATTADWTKPTTDPKPAFNKARGVIANAPDVPSFLAKQGLDPVATIQNGRYETQETAQALRDTAAKMSTETLKPSLKTADYSTPKTPVTELEKAAEDSVNNLKGVTETDRASMLGSVKSNFSALKTKFPNGMSLEDMHDSKIDYGKNGYPKPLQSISDSNEATANRAISSSLQKAVETKGEAAGVPVGEFNGYLSKYYKAADYLDALNGKVAPVSLGRKVVRAVAKGVGAAVGAHFGGLPTEFAGYSIGGALEHAVENMTNPVRTSFLSNLEKTNPEAFNRVVSYLKNANGGNSSVPKLPAGSFTAPPAPSPEAQMRSRATVLSKTPTQ